MAIDDGRPQWGTIYLDASREATLDKLDAMQAAARREQRNQRAQNEYVDRVREKAVQRAREILGAAYAERQQALEEAAQDAQRIREEARLLRADAEASLADAENIRRTALDELEAAKVRHAASDEEGFNAGLERAREEVAQFRANMGASLAEVLQGVHVQCGVIFEGWRKELTELLKVCVEKIAGLVLDEHRRLVLDRLIMDAVRQLGDRRCITLRVRPEDEAAAADLFAAAKERLPDIGQWMVVGDPGLESGGVVAESQSGIVDNRLELYTKLVDDILRRLVLPATELDATAALTMEEVIRRETEKLAALISPAVETFLADAAPTEIGTASSPLPETAKIEPSDAPTELQTDFPPAEAEQTAPVSWENDASLSPGEVLSSPPLLTRLEAQEPPPAEEPFHEPSREELEEELLPLPDEPPANTPHVEAVLAGGGFLDASDEAPEQGEGGAP